MDNDWHDVALRSAQEIDEFTVELSLEFSQEFSAEFERNNKPLGCSAGVVSIRMGVGAWGSSPKTLDTPNNW